MSEMIERVAKAIDAAANDAADDYEEYCSPRMALAAARAAIEAMREPTDEMFRDGQEISELKMAEETWWAMIDAALNSGTEPVAHGNQL